MAKFSQWPLTKFSQWPSTKSIIPAAPPQTAYSNTSSPSFSSTRPRPPFWSCRPQDVGQTDTHPLVPGHLRVEEHPAVAVAVDGRAPGHHLETFLQVLDARLHRPVHETTGPQPPGPGIHLRRRNAGVPYEVPGRRDPLLVKQISRGLSVQQPGPKQSVTIFALDSQPIGGQCFWETGRHGSKKRIGDAV